MMNAQPQRSERGLKQIVLELNRNIESPRAALHRIDDLKSRCCPGFVSRGNVEQNQFRLPLKMLSLKPVDHAVVGRHLRVNAEFRFASFRIADKTRGRHFDVVRALGVGIAVHPLAADAPRIFKLDRGSRNQIDAGSSKLENASLQLVVDLTTISGE